MDDRSRADRENRALARASLLAPTPLVPPHLVVREDPIRRRPRVVVWAAGAVGVGLVVWAVLAGA